MKLRSIRSKQLFSFVAVICQVPRPRISRVGVRERYLELASNGARLSLAMAPELRQAAARWLC